MPDCARRTLVFVADVDLMENWRRGGLGGAFLVVFIIVVEEFAVKVAVAVAAVKDDARFSLLW